MPRHSRRDLLRMGAGLGLVAFSGCSTGSSADSGGGGGGILGGVDRSEPWPPREPYDKPSLEELPDLDPPSLGQPSAPTVDVYHDLAAGACGVFFEKTLPRLLEMIGDGNLLLRYRDRPLPTHDWSYPMAIAARSVQYHAEEPQFWEFIKIITREHRPETYYYMTKDRILSAARQVGVDDNIVRQETESWRFFNVVERDNKNGKNIGVFGVPSAVVHTSGGIDSIPSNYLSIKQNLKE